MLLNKNYLQEYVFYVNRSGLIVICKDVGFKVLKLAKMPIVHLGWLKKYFLGNTGHSD